MSNHNSVGDIEQTGEPLETLAHRLWVHWSQRIAEEEDIDEERVKQWEQNWVPYEDLDEDTKEVDRPWMRCPDHPRTIDERLDR